MKLLTWTAIVASRGLLGAGALAPAKAADAYPAGNVTMIVPFPAGGPSDTVARIIADGMSKQLGHTVVIENVGGAGGTLGVTAPRRRSRTAIRSSPAAWGRWSRRRPSTRT